MEIAYSAPEIDQQLVRQIKNYASQGRSKRKIAALTGQHVHLISYVAYREGIRISQSGWHEKDLPSRPEVDRLLTGEYSLRQISGKLAGEGYSMAHETVRNYLIRRQLHAGFLEKRSRRRKSARGF